MSNLVKLTGITISFIPHENQRYPTVGDWQINEKEVLHLRISELPDARMEFALVLHELTEALLCRIRGITPEAVDAWDIHGEGADLDDPGADPRAPYFNEHAFATHIEEAFVNEVDVDWHEYETALDTLSHTKENEK